MNQPLAAELTPTNSASSTTSAGQWMALIAALLGWMFDGAEMGVFSMVGRAAVQDLLGFSGIMTETQERDVTTLFSIIMAAFLVGAAAGGVLFGWLGDRIGRVRAMSLSVLTYALFTGFCGLAQTPFQLGILRFIASLGMGGEWSLGVALVMEVWPNRSRALMAGLIGAAANVGYVLVGVIGIGLSSILTNFEAWLPQIGFSQATATMLVANKGWRLMMLLGTLPALLTFFFRIFVPESEKWEHERGRGGTSNWRTVDLLGVLIGSLGPAVIVYVWSDQRSTMPVRIVGTVLGMGIAAAGYIYPVYRYLQRTYASSDAPSSETGRTIRLMVLGAVISGVALIGTWGSTQWAISWAEKLSQKGDPTAVSAETESSSSATSFGKAFHARIWKNPREYTQMVSGFGAIVGTILAAMLGDWIGRRFAYCVLCVISFASVIWFYQFHSTFSEELLFAAFLLGACTASFYGWLPLYLPEIFKTNVRATGQGFGFNFGRILAAIANLQSGALVKLEFIQSTKTYAGEMGGYPVVCSIVSCVYIIGIAIIWLAPETRGKPLPD